MHKRCKILLLVAICVLLAAPQTAFSSVGVSDDGERIGIFTDINFTGDSTVTADGSVVNVDTDQSTTITLSGDLTFQTNLLALGIANGGVSEMVSGSTAIPVTYAHVNIVITARTITMVDGKVGQVIVLKGFARIGGTLSIDPATSFGFRTITMDTNGETTTLLWIDDSKGWVVIGATGATVNLVND